MRRRSVGGGSIKYGPIFNGVQDIIDREGDVDEEEEEERRDYYCFYGILAIGNSQPSGSLPPLMMAQWHGMPLELFYTEKFAYILYYHFNRPSK